MRGIAICSFIESSLAVLSRVSVRRAAYNRSSAETSLVLAVILV